MSLATYEMGIIINFVAFVLGLLCLFLIFGIVKRTKDKIRFGFNLIFFSLLVFVVFEVLKIVEFYQGVFLFSEVFLVVFVCILAFGVYQLKTLIMNISDFGQVFLVVSNDQYEDKVSSVVKNVKGVCYLSLNKSCNEVVGFLKDSGVDVSDFKFIDGTGSKSFSDETCVSVSNNPDDIKKTLDRVLRENEISCVIVDDVSSVKGIESFELPLFVQDASSLIRSNESQGFFIGRMEVIDKKMINDISMLVDKIIGE